MDNSINLSDPTAASRYPKTDAAPPPPSPATATPKPSAAAAAKTEVLVAGSRPIDADALRAFAARAESPKDSAPVAFARKALGAELALVDAASTRIRSAMQNQAAAIEKALAGFAKATSKAIPAELYSKEAHTDEKAWEGVKHELKKELVKVLGEKVAHVAVEALEKIWPKIAKALCTMHIDPEKVIDKLVRAKLESFEKSIPILGTAWGALNAGYDAGKGLVDIGYGDTEKGMMRLLGGTIGAMGAIAELTSPPAGFILSLIGGTIGGLAEGLPGTKREGALASVSEILAMKPEDAIKRVATAKAEHRPVIVTVTWSDLEKIRFNADVRDRWRSLVSAGMEVQVYDPRFGTGVLADIEYTARERDAWAHGMK